MHAIRKLAAATFGSGERFDDRMRGYSCIRIAAAVALTADDVNAWLDGYMPYALHTGDIAGAVVAVVKDGKILTMRGYGYSDVEKRTPVDPKLTLFRPGSVSKLVTWTAVMQLVEQGKIDLDADVNQYLGFQDPRARRQAGHHAQPHAARGGFRGTGQGHHVGGSQGAGIRSAAQAMGARAGLRAWLDARVFQLWRLARRLHRAAAIRESFDDYVDKHIFAAARYEAFELPSAVAGGPGAADVQGLPAGVRASACV